MKKLKPISRWIRLQTNYNVNKRNSLYRYAQDENGYTDGSANFNPAGGLYLTYFRHNGRTYAFEQFLSRWGVIGFDKECRDYPAFISGYDGEMYGNETLCELSEDGEKIRLWQDVTPKTFYHL